MKTPITRLMDMICGWADFLHAEKESDVTDEVLDPHEVFMLYQSAGYLSTQLKEDEEYEVEADTVRKFVEEQVLPLLLRK